MIGFFNYSAAALLFAPALGLRVGLFGGKVS
jgi:hypothetical protein